MKRSASLIAILFLPALAWTQGTGSFQISQNDFKSLFNAHRVAQPQAVPWAGSYFPYSQDGTAVKLARSGHPDARGRSPLEVYDRLTRQTGAKSSEAWERENHTCRHHTGDMKKSCEGWWGHCNGWAAAAIKEVEPRGEIRVGGEILSVAEQKALFAELWLSSSSLFAGDTDKSVKTGDWVHAHGSNSLEYRKFWDVSPRTMFLIFANYIGLQKVGVVIDRHTGDEVWNQPVVGYRILPLRPTDIRQVTDRGVSYWSVFLRMKMYWANDLGTPPGHVSTPFDVFRMTSDNEAIERFSNGIGGHDYEGRLVQFRLMFDGPVTVSPDGTQVISAGRMVGEGIWDHQENSRRFSAEQLNHSHPDFIWLPTNPVLSDNGYGNPYVTTSAVAMIRGGRPPAGSGPGGAMVSSIKAVFSPRSFHANDLQPGRIKGRVKALLAREGLSSEIRTNDIQMTRDRIVVPITFSGAISASALTDLFRSAGMPATFEN